ncbi:hypothetical protein BDZ94DRAFT_1235041 [Collybia nuda]|uniref:Uncharacterized protein n=1 Tax=Collybia nuda TaxID=64659 RepID=A0A9P6CLE6_9AGAR|nr:hypothetical protein BDZ94DRAFT_1235041 [Collybia nuda]
MLSANVPETPRPRPPAKVRRASESLRKNDPSPPPYYNSSAFAFTPQGRPHLNTTLLGSPMAATFQRVGWEADRDPLSPASEEDLEWMNEKSREELSELLVKADDIIKERENELGLASAVCKSLYENNVTLKTKHQALLARIPSTPSRSPSPSPSPEPTSAVPSRYSTSLSLTGSEYNPSIPSSYKGHARKVSVSTAEISHLADQNAELLDKLEKLESESFSADQSGRRVLKRLEKEISTLREELEKTQAKSEELEEKTKAGFGWDSEKVVEEVLRKKQERELRFKAMRNLGQGFADDDEGDPEIRDFAPEGSLFGGPSATYSFFPSGESPRRTSGTPFNRSTLPRPEPIPSPVFEPESSLIAKLLVKIQELEDANSRIIEQQTETTNQLNAMQRETEQISKVYESFADENIIEFASDTGSDAKGGDPSSHDQTIRFKSSKRSLRASETFNRWGENGMRSVSQSSLPKVRKSVVGLFDGPTEASYVSQQTKSSGLPVPFSSSSRDEGHRPMRSIGSMGLISPALSTLSLSPSRSPVTSPLDPLRPTLDSELGNEFNDGWGLNTGNHHLRTSSLYDLTQMSAPPSPSPSPSRMSHDHSRFTSQDSEAVPTSMTVSNVALRLSVEPPTPDKVPGTGMVSVGKQSARYHRMSQTLRSRTNRWMDGRFKDTLTGGSGIIEPHIDSDGDEPPPMTPLPLRLSKAFDDAIENITGHPRESDSRSRSASDDEGMVVDIRAEKKRSEKPSSLGSVMLELWLWLQFVIIIVVFLWAMARRGPKSVLGQPVQRRIISESARR